MRPRLQLVGTEHWTAGHQAAGGLSDVVVALVEGVHGMEQSDVSGGGGSSQTQADLRLLGSVQKGSSKCPDGSEEGGGNGEAYQQDGGDYDYQLTTSLKNG